MSKQEIPQTVFNRYDRIYIDASALMNNTALELFLEKYEDRIMSSETPIIIHESVQLELARFMTGNDPDKHRKTMGCMDILGRHPGLIVCGSSNLPEELVNDAFADPDILAELLKGKRRFRQLLITNDGGLSLDALDLNRQHSCQGKPVSVKKITRNGCLKSFNEKRYLAALERNAEKAVRAESRKIVDRPAAPQGAANPAAYSAPKPTAPDSTVPTTPTVPDKSFSSFGVSYFQFVLGMIAAGIFGAFIGAQAIPATHSTEANPPIAA